MNVIVETILNEENYAERFANELQSVHVFRRKR